MSGDRFESGFAGFAITKVPSWVFSTFDAEIANRQRVSVGNPDTDEAIRKKAAAPLVVIARYPEPSELPNPTVKVLVRPMDQTPAPSAAALARTVANSIKQVMPSFELDGAIEEVQVGGRPGASFRSRFTIRLVDGGTTYEVRSRTWVVPRPGYMIMIAASDPTEDDHEADFARMIGSIEIRK